MNLTIDNIKLRGEEDILVLCYDGKKLVGHCRMLDKWSGMERLYVIPEYRNKGISEAILVYAGAMASLHGVKIGRGACKEDLLPMYLKYGFKIVSGPDEGGLYHLEEDHPGV